MHGIIYRELQKYVDTKFGGDTWATLLKKADLGGKMYTSLQHYPDAEAVALVTTASHMTGLPAAAILEDFGEFIAPDLLSMYKAAVKPEWKTLDLIENTEQTIHKIVRINNPGATPPVLQVTRTSPTEVVLTYTSARKMCAVAKGIAKGVAKHYNERVAITETACMLKGSPSCKLSIKLL